MRRTHFLIETAVNPVADAEFLIARLNMNIAGIFANGVIKQVINKFDYRRLVGYFFEVAYILGDIFYQCKIIEALSSIMSSITKTFAAGRYV
jgi:hypothetical protein